jgi:hypothetical protein
VDSPNIKLPPVSYSFHNDWEGCPRRSWHRFIARDLPREPESPALAWGNKVHKALEQHIREKTPLPAEMAHYGHLYQFPDGYDVLAEVQLGIKEDGQTCNFWDPDVWARGKIDVVLAPPQSGTAIIIDHKTGKNLREDPAELYLHAVLLKAAWPSTERIKGWYNWLHYNKMGQVHDLSDTKAVLGGMHWTRNRIARAFELGYKAFPPKQGPLCGWCPVKHCEFHP